MRLKIEEQIEAEQSKQKINAMIDITSKNLLPNE